MIAIAIALGLWIKGPVMLGAVLAFAIVVGLSAAGKKADWYVHPVMLGMALYGGAAIAAGLDGLKPFRGQVILAAAVAPLALIGVVVDRPTERKTQVRAIQEHPGPPPEAGKVIADCGQLGPWVGAHLFAFVWKVERAECDDPRATVKFDGRRLVSVSARR